MAKIEQAQIFYIQSDYGSYGQFFSAVQSLLFTNNLGYITLTANGSNDAYLYMPELMKERGINLAIIGEESLIPMNGLGARIKSHFPKMPIIGLAAKEMDGVNKFVHVLDYAIKLAPAVSFFARKNFKV